MSMTEAELKEGVYVHHTRHAEGSSGCVGHVTQLHIVTEDDLGSQECGCGVGRIHSRCTFGCSGGVGGVIHIRRETALRCFTKVPGQGETGRTVAYEVREFQVPDFGDVYVWNPMPGLSSPWNITSHYVGRKLVITPSDESYAFGMGSFQDNDTFDERFRGCFARSQFLGRAEDLPGLSRWVSSGAGLDVRHWRMLLERLTPQDRPAWDFVSVRTHTKLSGLKF